MLLICRYAADDAVDAAAASLSMMPPDIAASRYAIRADNITDVCAACHAARLLRRTASRARYVAAVVAAALLFYAAPERDICLLRRHNTPDFTATYMPALRLFCHIRLACHTCHFAPLLLRYIRC